MLLAKSADLLLAHLTSTFNVAAKNLNDEDCQGIVQTSDYQNAAQEYHTCTDDSRNGPVISIQHPVHTCLTNNSARVVTNRKRDCNPFFHAMESIWIIAGSRDLSFLSRFAKQMKEYSDDGHSLYGAYGYRLRYNRSGITMHDNAHAYDKVREALNGGSVINPNLDQIETAINHLTENPKSRRVCLNMYAPEDLVLSTKLGDDQYRDLPCNTHIYLRPRFDSELDKYYLDMTVCNRSNDLMWGMMGANVFHFSCLLDYMAARLDMAPGALHQVTNNLHLYTDTFPQERLQEILNEYDLYCEEEHYRRPVTARLANNPSEALAFERDCRCFLDHTTPTSRKTFPHAAEPSVRDPQEAYETEWFRHIGIPLYYAYRYYKDNCPLSAQRVLQRSPKFASDALLVEANEWLQRRIDGKKPSQPKEDPNANADSNGGTELSQPEA